MRLLLAQRYQSHYDENFALLMHSVSNLVSTETETNLDLRDSLFMQIAERLELELLYAPLPRFVKALSEAILETALQP